MFAPGQVGECSLVAAVDALGPLAAKRAAHRCGARMKVEGEGGLGGLKAPSFEPDVGRIRQQARW